MGFKLREKEVESNGEEPETVEHAVREQTRKRRFQFTEICEHFLQDVRISRLTSKKTVGV